MKSIINMTIAGCFVMSSLGCASRTTLTINSVPAGAYITEVGTGKAFGIAPVTVIYDGEKLWKSMDANGCFTVSGFQAKWISGATTALNPISGCKGVIERYSISLERDQSAPGLDKDMEFAVKVQAVQAQQQQAQSSQDAAIISAWSALQSGSTNCTTRAIGETISTSCR